MDGYLNFNFWDVDKHKKILIKRKNKFILSKKRLYTYGNLTNLPYP